jgi:hypothetical protein
VEEGLKNVFIFGTGSASVRTSLYLRLIRYNISGYLDNEPSKWNKSFNARTISPPRILENEINPVVFIASQHYRLIYRQLKKMRIVGLVVNVPPILILYGPVQLGKTILSSMLWNVVWKFQAIVRLFGFYLNQYRLIRSLRKSDIVAGSNNEIVDQVKAILRSKNTSTAYILGCGTSINSFTVDDFTEVSRGLTLGLNGFIYHKFDADIYSFEFDDTSAASAFRDELPFYFDRPETKNFWQLAVFKDMHRMDLGVLKKISEVCPNLYAAGICYLPLHGVTHASFSVSRFYKLVCFLRRRFFSTFPVFFQQIGSLDYAIDLLIASGVKNVVLCGVDLDDKGYFWEEQTAGLTFHKERFPKDSNRIKGYNYAEFVRRKFGLSILDVLKNLENAPPFFGFDGVSFFVRRDCVKVPRVPLSKGSV